MKNERFDIDEIFETIEKDIKENTYIDEMQPFSNPLIQSDYFESYDVTRITEETQNLKNNYSVDPLPLIKSSGFSLAIKKIIRKSVKFYVVPLVERQNDVNKKSADILDNIGFFIRCKEDETMRINNLEKQFVKEVHKPFFYMQKENGQLKTQLNAMTDNYHHLKAQVDYMSKQITLLQLKIEFLELGNRKNN